MLIAALEMITDVAIHILVLHLQYFKHYLVLFASDVVIVTFYHIAGVFWWWYHDDSHNKQQSIPSNRLLTRL